MKDVVMLMAGVVVVGFSGECRGQLIADDMLSLRGEDFVAARDEFVAAPPWERSEILAELRRNNEWRADVLADILEVRVDHPVEAAEFDSRLRDALESPRITRAGTPKYRGWLPKGSAVADPLAWEAIRFHEIPPALSRSFIAFLGSPERDAAVHVEPLLACLDVDDRLATQAALTLGAVGERHDDPRIVPALRDFYLELSARRLTDTYAAKGVCAGLVRIATPESLIAVGELMAIEKRRLSDEGFAPWDDDEVLDDLKEVMVADARLQGRLGPRERDATEAELAAAETRRLAVERRMQARRIWKPLERTRTLLIKAMARKNAAKDAAGGQPNASEPERGGGSD